MSIIFEKLMEIYDVKGLDWTCKIFNEKGQS